MLGNSKELSINNLINDDNIVINEVYVKGYYCPELKLYGIVWNGVFSNEEYKFLFDEILDFAEENPISGIYSDVRRQGKVSPTSRNYFKNVVSPRGDKIGISKAAVVIEDLTFKIFYLNAITKLAGKRAKIFSVQDEAIRYLLM
ncbi:MAG: hypothetical protein ACI9XJ_000294 [Marivirga sp.]|jgi:hypothetical protein